MKNIRNWFAVRRAGFQVERSFHSRRLAKYLLVSIGYYFFNLGLAVASLLLPKPASERNSLFERQQPAAAEYLEADNAENSGQGVGPWPAFEVLIPLKDPASEWVDELWSLLEEKKKSSRRAFIPDALAPAPQQSPPDILVISQPLWQEIAAEMSDQGWHAMLAERYPLTCLTPDGRYQVCLQQEQDSWRARLACGWHACNLSLLSARRKPGRPAKKP